MPVFARNVGFAMLLAIALAPFAFLRTEPLSWRFDPGAAGVCHQSDGDRVNILHRVVTTERLTPFVHAPSVVETQSGDLLAVWYGGTREGSRDTRIFSARLRPGTDRWSPSQVLIDRRTTAVAVNRPIRRLGNPVVARDASDRLWLFYVSTSIGGWATSAINVMNSMDDGRSWTKPRRLVSSPFINISTLVKGGPVIYGDGTLGLPVYHEFLGKFAEFLRLDQSGRVVSKTRLTWGRRALQPVVVPMAERRAVALMRDSRRGGGRVLLARTSDGGRNWSPAAETDRPNPNSAVAAAPYGPSGIALIFNDSPVVRRPLVFAVSHDDGRSWHREAMLDPPAAGDTLAEGRGDGSLDYPFALCTKDGRLHVVYADRHREIRHAVVGGELVPAQ